MKQYFTKSGNYTEPEPRHKLCCTFGSVTLQQRGKDNFAVRYFKQVTADLTYAQAAAEFGACIMHEVACDGNLDNRMKGEK